MFSKSLGDESKAIDHKKIPRGDWITSFLVFMVVMEIYFDI